MVKSRIRWSSRRFFGCGLKNEMSLAQVILYLLIGVFLAQIVYYYPNLPETVASHFNGLGEPDGWMSRQNFVIFESVLLLIIIFEFTLLPIVLKKMPNSWTNLPNKGYWLGAERREATFGTIRSYFEWCSIALLSLFIAVNQLVFRANINRENLSSAEMWLIIGAFSTFTVIWLIKFIRQFRLRS